MDGLCVVKSTCFWRSTISCVSRRISSLHAFGLSDVSMFSIAKKRGVALLRMSAKKKRR